MKKTKTFYWIVTAIFAGFMIFSAVPDVMVAPDAVKLFSSLGYPNYLIPFLGVAKILGAVAILIPPFNRIKEWAYAGLFFDILGATYSGLAVGGFQPEILFMILPIGFLFLSYFLWHKTKKTIYN